MVSHTVSGNAGLREAAKVKSKLPQWQLNTLMILKRRLELHPGESSFGSDKVTAEIAEATRIWRESWILPAIDALIEGNPEKAGWFA